MTYSSPRLAGLPEWAVVAKRLLHTVTGDQAVHANLKVLELVLSVPLVQALSRYLDSFPLLRGLGLYVSPQNGTVSSGKMFNTDNHDFPQITFFFNVKIMKPTCL